MSHKFQTEQEEFWAGDFGNDYISRNVSTQLLASNLQLYSKIIAGTGKLNSIIEFGANVGMNLKALHQLMPDARLDAIEINESACSELEKMHLGNVYCTSILDYTPDTLYDLTLIKGVLIHINPEVLPVVYEKLYSSTGQYLCVAEYYNPSPVTISYRGFTDRLYKRDFAGELMSKYSNLSLIDYGFCYHKDPVFPQDDITWFLLKKK